MVRNYKEAQKIVGFYQYEEGNSRPKGDFYATPEIAISKLLDAEKFGSNVLEPCCGNGAISKVLENYGYTVTSRDLNDWGYGNTGIDFLNSPVEDFDAIVTNPPFNLSLEFTQRALEFTKAKQGKVAMLNRLQWLASAKRRKLFESTPLSKVWVFSKRIPRMNRFEFTGKSSTSLIDFAWFVFDWKHVGPANLGWI